MKIVICGCNGKMGKALKNIIDKSENLILAAGIDKVLTGKEDFPAFKSIENLNTEADVLIDFSHPSALESILNYCENKNLPAVICTTGLDEIQVEKIKKASKKIPVFYSRNMSIGINLLITLAKKATEFLSEGFDIEIIEKHHNQKIDAPSGTALMIAEEISKKRPKTNYVFDRTNTRNKRSKEEIGISCIRAGSICGDHEVIFAGENEIITISHHAQSRNIFASGSIKAAMFVTSKSPGFYTMEDMV